MKFLSVVFLLAILGCAAQPSIDEHARNKDWEKVLTYIAVNIGNESKTSTDDVKKITEQYPEVIQYSEILFSEKNIKEFADENRNTEFLQFRLRAYCLITNNENCKAAQDNINRAQKNIKPTRTTLSSLFLQLKKSEQEKLLDIYKFDFIEDNEIGIISDRQVQNISQPGSNAGAEIGGAIGATTYITNSTPSSYSMKSDLTSTLLGALAGAALLNKSPTEQYVTRYTLKLRDGNIKQVDQVSSTPLGQGVGMCVLAANASPVDQSFCSMTMSEFKSKFSEELKN